MFKKMVMFAASLASRGISNKKIDVETKQLRVLSCFGNNSISPCSYLQLSKNKINHFCGHCGCGDHKHTWLEANSNEYSKLDYPKLHCPMRMPGFSNYDPNFYQANIKERKTQIEDLDPNDLQTIKVTVNGSTIK